MKEKPKHYYLLHIIRDVEPEILGPYETEESRDKAAKKLKAKDDESGIFMLDIVAKRGHAIPTIPKAYAYSARFFAQPCDVCKGKKRIPCPYCEGENLDKEPCFECDSKGAVPCPECDGTGVMEDDQTD